MEVLFPMLEKNGIYIKSENDPKECLHYTEIYMMLISIIDNNAFQNHLLFANESYEINPQSVHIYLFNIIENYFFSETIYQEHIYMF